MPFPSATTLEGRMLGSKSNVTPTLYMNTHTNTKINLDLAEYYITILHIMQKYLETDIFLLFHHVGVAAVIS